MNVKGSGLMSVAAFVPIKLNNQRLPGKNLLPLNGKPLCAHIFEALLNAGGIDRVVAYCSDPALADYLPEGVDLLLRDSCLDGNLVKGLEIYRAFVEDVYADVYVLAHATSPFVRPETIRRGVDAVVTGGHDSAFAAERVQTFAWYKGKPVNYSPEDVPRTQDMEPVWVETSAFYVFRREVLVEHGRRIGYSPEIVEVSGMEAVDIDEPADYEMAKRMIGEIDG